MKKAFTSTRYIGGVKYWLFDKYSTPGNAEDGAMRLKERIPTADYLILRSNKDTTRPFGLYYTF